MQYKGKGRIVAGEPVMGQAPNGEAILIEDRGELKIVSESLFVLAYLHPWVSSLSLFSAFHSISLWAHIS